MNSDWSHVSCAARFAVAKKQGVTRKVGVQRSVGLYGYMQMQSGFRSDFHPAVFHLEIPFITFQIAECPLLDTRDFGRGALLIFVKHHK